MRLFRDRGFSAGLVTQGAFQGSLAGFALVLTVYIQTGLGWSAHIPLPQGIRSSYEWFLANQNAARGVSSALV